MQVDNVKIDYIQYGKDDGQDLVFLAGWQNTKESMITLADAFKIDFKVTLIDLPGMGKSEDPHKMMNIKDYATFLNKVLITLKIDNPTIIGHSFGGRVAGVYASLYKVNKLVLFSVPLFATNKKKIFGRELIITKKLNDAKRKKKEFKDYNHTSDLMKKIYINMIETDISAEVTKITVPTIILLGTKDPIVDVEEAKKMRDLIKTSGLITYYRKMHYAFLDDSPRTVNILDRFLDEERRYNHEI